MSGSPLASACDVVAGLANFGNTCYANALLQALASCEHYCSYLQLLFTTFPVPQNLEAVSPRGVPTNWKSSLPLTRAVTCCLERLQPSYLRKPMLASALEVLHGVGQHDRRLFAGFGEQQDVGEVLDCIVSASQIEIKAWGQKYLQQPSALRLSDPQSGHDTPSSIIRNTVNGVRPVLQSEMHSFTIHQFQSLGGFDGVLSHNLECCSCGHGFDVQLNPFTSLMLPLSNLHMEYQELTVDAECTLESCLRDFFTTKKQGPIRCPKCSVQCTLACGAQSNLLPLQYLHSMSNQSSSSSSSPSVMDEEINNWQRRHSGLGHVLEQESPRKGVIYRFRASFDTKEFQNNSFRPSMPEPGSRTAILKEVVGLAKGAIYSEPQITKLGNLLGKIDIPWMNADSHVNATTTLAKCPKVLVISLQRKIFDGTSYRKIQGRVQYPLSLDMAACTSYKSVHGTKYRLKAVLVHQGNENSGHYVTVRSILSEDGKSHQWILASDDKVYKVSENAALGLEASMLFYERVRKEAPTAPLHEASSFIDVCDLAAP